jgi:hypothetical protein
MICSAHFYRCAVISLLTGMLFNFGVSAESASPYIIDVHAHLLSGSKSSDRQPAADSAIELMDKFNVVTTLIMPPPQTVNQGHDETVDSYQNLSSGGQRKFYYLGGGGSLNVMIQQAVSDGRVSDQMRQRFRRHALHMLDQGAIGFGEMTSEHVSRRGGHPYISAPPDHPLYLLLADIAAEKDVPIDLHMEAVPEPLARPEGLSSANPDTLPANIANLERLLVHNRKTQIIWSHAGWDNSGERTVDLSRRLLAAHDNLHMSLKIAGGTSKDTRPVKNGKNLKGSWKKLIEDFPDRFMIGSDMKYRGGGRTRGGGLKTYRAILKQLPPETAKMVAHENAERLFKLKR